MSDQITESEQSPKQSNVHTARAAEFVNSQILGITAALGAVWVGHNVVPEKLERATNAVEKIVQKYRPDFSPEFSHEYSRMIVNNALMYSAGFCATVTSSVKQARHRRSREDSDKDYSIFQDTKRVALGWGAGVIGAQTAWEFANTFMRKGKGSSRAINNWLGESEAALDKYLFDNVKIGENTRFSESLVANLTMVCGAAPAVVIAQDMYDKLVHEPSQAQGR